jgi:DnaJ-class molecular chaperone
MDHYLTLGVNRDADPKTIKLAYKRLASKYHPDKGGDAERFKEVQKAYDVLGTPDKKAEYDNPIQNNPFSPGAGNPFGDIFGDIFGQRTQRQAGNPDSVGDVQIPLSQAYSGTDLSINIDGKSRIITIDPGTRNGARVRLHKEGRQPDPNYPPGDLIIRLHIVIPEGMQIVENDIYQHIVINAIEAMVGCVKYIDHISGKKLSVKIPRSSQNGSRLRLSNQGMPYPGAPEVKGSLYVIVNINVPNINDPRHIQMLNSINEEI